MLSPDRGEGNGAFHIGAQRSGAQISRRSVHGLWLRPRTRALEGPAATYGLAAPCGWECHFGNAVPSRPLPSALPFQLMQGVAGYPEGRAKPEELLRAAPLPSAAVTGAHAAVVICPLPPVAGINICAWGSSWTQQRGGGLKRRPRSALPSLAAAMGAATNHDRSSSTRLSACLKHMMADSVVICLPQRDRPPAC